jgi:hypothetical protein
MTKKVLHNELNKLTHAAANILMDSYHFGYDSGKKLMKEYFLRGSTEFDFGDSTPNEAIQELIRISEEELEVGEENND